MSEEVKGQRLVSVRVPRLIGSLVQEVTTEATRKVKLILRSRETWLLFVTKEDMSHVSTLVRVICGLANQISIKYLGMSMSYIVQHNRRKVVSVNKQTRAFFLQLPRWLRGQML